MVTLTLLLTLCNRRNWSPRLTASIDLLLSFAGFSSLSLNTPGLKFFGGYLPSLPSSQASSVLMSDLAGSSLTLENHHLSGLPFPPEPLSVQFRPDCAAPPPPAPRPSGGLDEDSEDHKSSTTGSPTSRSSFSEGPFRFPLKRSPKDTECVHCHNYFTPRGVLLHAQRCSKKRASDVASMVEKSTKAVQTRAHQEKELYESVVREMRQEMTTLRSTLQETVCLLEYTKKDYQLSLEYADAVAVELHSARSEIIRLQQVVDFAFGGAKVSNEMDENIARLLSPHSN